VLLLITIPLLIAARYRDDVDFHQLPLAGQILGAAQIVAIIIPASVAPLLNGMFHYGSTTSTKNLIERGVAMFLFAISLWPIRLELRREWRLLNAPKQDPI
jgi:hypothetical protein